VNDITIPQGHVPAGGQLDGTTPKYLAGFRAAVRQMMGSQPSRWATTYGDAARIEQLLQKAYQQGLLDGHALVTPVAAPGPVADETVEVPRLSQEEVWADLGLFEPSSTPPQKIGQILSTVVVAPLEGDPFAWAVRQTRATLDMSLAEATEFVRGVLG
jgi:hypothetical protein